jgi:hypothetical protein
MERGITTYLKRYNPVTVTQRLVNYKKIRSLLGVKLVALEASLETERKKGFFKQNRWRFSKKAKCLIVFAIITVMLVSIFAFLPRGSQSTPNKPQSSDNPTASPSATQGTNNGSNTLSQFAQFFSNLAGSAAQAFSQPKPPGVIESAQTINSTVWMQVAANAWAYFQPGVGVDSNTGLPYAGGATGFHYFTDWDLGVYIQAVIDAQNLNLTTTDGAWGSYARLDNVLTFLETRDLNNASYPYWFYDATTGLDYHALSDLSTDTVDVVDTGRLFVALNNLRNFNNTLMTRINNITLYGQLYGRSNYTALVPSIANGAGSNSIYAYYFDSGFASFWPQLASVPGKILGNIVNSGNVTSPYGNVSLPNAAISCDPLLCSVFELNNNDSRLLALSRQVYLAHEAYYNATGQYAAFSEGNSPNGFVWEWVTTGSGDTWKITQSGSSSYVDMSPVVYNKVAFSFLALYNTTFARNMVVYLEQNLPTPTNGYSDGADNSGNLVSQVGSNTNGLILSAATYAIQKNP